MKRVIFVLLGLVTVLSVQSYGQRKFRNGFDTAYYTAVGIAGSINSENYPVREKAAEIKKEYPGTFTIAQVSDAFNYLYKNWDYVPDPQYELFRPAGAVINNPLGDCDDYAIGMVALIEALGGVGRVVCVSGHAYPEVLIGKDMSDMEIKNVVDSINAYYYKNYSYKKMVSSINYHIDHDGTYWMNLDYQEDYPGGNFIETSTNAEHTVIYSDGSYRKSFLNLELADFISKKKAI